MYVVENKTTYNIASIFGIHRSTVSNRLKEFNIQSKLAIHQKEIDNRILTKIQKDFLVGSMLGDGHIVKSGRFAKYSTSHSKKQKEYITWISEIFGSLGRGLKLYNSYNKKYNRTYEFYNFNTVIVPELLSFRNNFYDHLGKKIIPSNLKNILNSPLSLAVWLMEDGHLNTRTKGTYLCTDCFSYEEHKILQDILVDNFSLSPKIIKYNNTFRLRFGVAESKKIPKLVKSYFVDSMKYKLL